jgi:hypothetical protein
VNTEFNTRCPAEAMADGTMIEDEEGNVISSFKNGVYTDIKGEKIKCYRPHNFD